MALRFLILTAARPSEVRFASHSEISGDVWIIPAERTKPNFEHRVPLTAEALDVIEIAGLYQSSELLFPSAKGKVISDATMSRFMERQSLEYRPHGLRASFRTWVEEQTETPFEVKETAFGHKVDTGIIGAYQRSDRLDKRAILMGKWASFLLGEP